jgi:hypothetical protein
VEQRCETCGNGRAADPDPSRRLTQPGRPNSRGRIGNAIGTRRSLTLGPVFWLRTLISVQQADSTQWAVCGRQRISLFCLRRLPTAVCPPPAHSERSRLPADHSPAVALEAMLPIDPLSSITAARPRRIFTAFPRRNFFKSRRALQPPGGEGNNSNPLEQSNDEKNQEECEVAHDHLRGALSLARHAGEGRVTVCRAGVYLKAGSPLNKPSPQPSPRLLGEGVKRIPPQRG